MTLLKKGLVNAQTSIGNLLNLHSWLRIITDIYVLLSIILFVISFIFWIWVETAIAFWGLILNIWSSSGEPMLFFVTIFPISA